MTSGRIISWMLTTILVAGSSGDGNDNAEGRFLRIIANLWLIVGIRPGQRHTRER